MCFGRRLRRHGLPHKRVLRSLELMAKQVLPRFNLAGRA